MTINRREFLAAGAAAAVAAGTLGASAAAANAPQRRFNLKYAPHFGMFKNHAPGGPLDELKFMADQGFTAMEDNGMKSKPKELQEQIRSEMDRLGMEMGVFVAGGGGREATLTTGKPEYREAFLKEIRESVDVAKRVNARWCTVVPGKIDHRQQFDYQTANVIEALRYASDIFAPAGLAMVLEPLNHWTNHPELFLSEVPQAYMICRAVDSPACKILFDIYHEQISEGNLIPNMDRAWEEIGYFQAGDNPGRKEPTTGEINYRNVFRHLYEKGYQGIIGMEHGNSKPGKEGELAVIEAYVECDRF